MDQSALDVPEQSVQQLLARYRMSTDTGNAERLADRARKRLRWVYGIGWLFWDTRRWQRDTTGEVVRQATDAVRAIYTEAADLHSAAARASDDADRQRLSDAALQRGRWARLSESEPRIRAMVKLAQAQPRLVVMGGAEALDADPDLLNVQNGMLDLLTFELYPHDPDRLLTKLTGAAHDPNAEAPFWNQLVEMILPDPDVRRWVQKAVGYSVLGSYSEWLFIPWGEGQNGKSTFLGALRYALGDYAHEANSELLAAQNERGAAANSALAGLRGARLVTSVETEQGKRLAEVLVKQLTGEGEVTAKFMRQDFFTFENQAAVWLATNHKPVVQGMDHAIWRRLRLIPFDVRIPDDRRLPPAEVTKRLHAERDGILRWVIDGLRMYRTEGMGPEPDVVTEATKAYHEEMDPLREWLEDDCVIDASTMVPTGALRSSYEFHCNQAGRKPLAANRFGQELRRLGLTDGRESIDGKRQRVWKGIRRAGQTGQ